MNRSLSDGRRRAREFLDAQQSLIDSLEGTIAEELQRASEQLVEPDVASRLVDQCDDDQEERAAWNAERVRQADELAAARAKVEADSAACAARQAEFVAERHALAGERDHLAAEREHLAAEQVAIRKESTQLADTREALNRARREYDADRENLGEQEDELERAREQIEEERRKLLREREQLAADRMAADIAAEQLAAEQARAARDGQRYRQEREQLDVELDRLATDQAALRIAAEQAEAVRQQAARVRERGDEERKQLEQQRTKVIAERAATRTAQEEAAAAKAELTRTRERLEAERQQLVAERERLAALDAETKNQRRRIAREFQVQRATHVAELERRRIELEALSTASQPELADQLEAASSESQALRDEAAQLRKVLNARAKELTELRGHCSELVTEIEDLRSQHERLAQDLAIQGSAGAADEEHVARLEHERDELARRLEAAESASGGDEMSSRHQEKLEEVQRRFELAIEDVRDLKRRNADLEARLASAQSGAATGAPSLAGGLDWEAQKRRLLATLEADDVDQQDDDRSREERLSIESTISITDQVVAEKDREIADLKQLLENQSSNLGSIAIGASAIAAILDEDDLVRQERERLAELQSELQAKLRQAEVDISLERAKIARDRAEIDEKQAVFQADVADRKAAGESAPDTSKHGKPVRGRWLARLGLKDLEE